MRSAPHLTSIERTWEGSSHRAMASRLSGENGQRHSPSRGLTHIRRQYCRGRWVIHLCHIERLILKVHWIQLVEHMRSSLSIWLRLRLLRHI